MKNHFQGDFMKIKDSLQEVNMYLFNPLILIALFGILFSIMLIWTIKYFDKQMRLNEERRFYIIDDLQFQIYKLEKEMQTLKVPKAKKVN